MPMDKEIHLAVVGPQAVFALAETLGGTMVDAEERAIGQHAFIDDPLRGLGMETPEVLDAKARAAWEDAIARKGWRIVAPDGNGVRLETEFGPRTAYPWALYVQFDPEEVGDHPCDATLGVNLSARYFPVFLDMAHEHGTLGSVIDLDALRADIEIAREAILAQIPELSEARVIVRDIFY